MNITFYILAQSSFQKYTTCWVFLAIHHMLYLCICIFVFALLTYGNTTFDILAQSSFHKYISCWVFLALSHMLYLCMCVCIGQSWNSQNSLRKCQSVFLNFLI